MMTFLTILLFVVDFFVTGFGTVFLWNNIVSNIFGITTLTFAQGYALSMVFSWFKGLEKHNEKELWKLLLKDLITSVMWLGGAWIFIQFI